MTFRLLCFIGVLVLSFLKIHAVTRISAGNGNWTTNGTWSPSGVPACGDSVIIQAVHTVTIPATVNLTGCGSPIILVVRGTLKFNNGRKLRLPCGSKLYIFGGGQILTGGGGGNSNVIEICNTEYWSAGDGTYSGPGCMPPSTPGCAAVLPVELVDFKGYLCNNAHICLQWQTATEKNNAYFEVERSADGYFFKPVQRVPSLAPGGTTGSSRVYQLTDELPFTGLNYYRLKQVDLDGSFSYGDIIVVDRPDLKEQSFSISPNPNSGKFSIRANGFDPAVPVKVCLRDNMGVLLSEKLYYPDPQNFSLEIHPPSVLSPGLYHCSFLVFNQWQHLPVLVN